MNDAPHYESVQATPVACACDPTSEADAEDAVSAAATADPCRSTEPDEAIPGAAGADPAISEDPGTDSDPDRDPSGTEAPTHGLDELRGELNALRQQLEAERTRHERAEREYEEFRQLYPDATLSDCSDDVWRAVESGTPLAAAYALEERRRALTADRAAQANAQNRQRSAGRVKDAQNDFFTPDEVRAMSQSEVRTNLSKIMRSMKKW